MGYNNLNKWKETAILIYKKQDNILIQQTKQILERSLFCLFFVFFEVLFGERNRARSWMFSFGFVFVLHSLSSPVVFVRVVLHCAKLNVNGSKKTNS